MEARGLDTDRKLGRRLAYLLIAGLVSCPAEAHAHWDSVHDSTCRRHLGLQETWAAHSATDTSRSFVERDEHASAFGLSARNRPLPASAMHLDRDQFPSASRLDAMFTGWREQDRWKGAEICLHTHDVPEHKIHPAAHDVDSFLHVTRDPSDFQGPLQICLSPQPNSLLSKSIHVKVPVRIGDKIERVPIHKIPHLVLAREKFTVIYMFFPRLYTGKKGASVHLRDDQHAIFFEGVIKPSFERIGMHFERQCRSVLQQGESVGAMGCHGRGTPRG
ncbi:MAG: hypothetical protein JWP34_4836 [Massilia sp.]|nr:hypothetical protein [Massilia sp.]